MVSVRVVGTFSVESSSIALCTFVAETSPNGTSETAEAFVELPEEAHAIVETNRKSTAESNLIPPGV